MAEPKQLKAIKGGLNIAKRLLADGENEAEAIAAITAAQRAEAGRKGAALIKSQPPVKASEALVNRWRRASSASPPRRLTALV